MNVKNEMELSLVAGRTRIVRFLSTKHKGEIISTGKKNRPNKIIGKPDAILHYNECKHGVDLSDQMSSYSSPLRKVFFVTSKLQWNSC